MPRVRDRRQQHRYRHALRVELAQHRRPASSKNARSGSAGPASKRSTSSSMSSPMIAPHFRAACRRGRTLAAARPSSSTLDLARDDVHGSAAVDDGRVRRCCAASPRALRPLAEQREAPRRTSAWSSRRPEHGGLRRGQRGGHRLDHLPRERRVMCAGVRSRSSARSIACRAAPSPRRAIGRAAWPPGPRTVALQVHICFSATWIG